MVTVFSPQKQLLTYGKNDHTLQRKYIGYYGSEVSSNENAFWEFCYKYTPKGVINYAAYVYGYDSYRVYKITNNSDQLYIPVVENPFCKQPENSVVPNPFDDIRLPCKFKDQIITVPREKFRCKNCIDGEYYKSLLNVEIIYEHNIKKEVELNITRTKKVVEAMMKEGLRNNFNEIP